MTARDLAAADVDGRGGLRPLPLGLAAGQSAEAGGSAGLGPGGRHAIGGLARGARGFATRIGLGFTARRAGLARAGVATDGLAVRPPVDFWPGGVDEPHPLDRVRTGDPAYDRLVNERRASAAAAAAGGSGSGTLERVGRGLPASIHRRGRTIAGPRTAPGAGGMRPGEIRPAPNEATRLAPSASSTTAASAGPRATAATGARPRVSSVPPAGGGRSAPTGGSGHPSGGSGRGGRSTTDDPGGADADLAALRAAIVARRNQQTGAETGHAATSSSVAPEASGERSPVRQYGHGAGQNHVDPDPEFEPRSDSGLSPDGLQAPAANDSTVVPRSAAEGLPVRHDAARSAANPGHGRTPHASIEIEPVSAPSRSHPASTPDTANEAPRRAAEADVATKTSRPAADTAAVEAVTNSTTTTSDPGTANTAANTSGPTTASTAAAPEGATAQTSTSGSAAGTSGPATTSTAAAPAAGTAQTSRSGFAAGAEPGTAAASGTVGAEGDLVRPSAAEGLPVRFSGLVTIESEQSPGSPGDAASPSSSPAAEQPTSSPTTARPTPPDSLPPADGRPETAATGSSVHAGSLATGGEPIHRSTEAGPAQLRSAAEGLPVRGTALPATSGDRQLPPSAPGSSTPRSATGATSGLPNGRSPAEHRIETATGDGLHPKNASDRTPTEHPTQGTTGDHPRPKNASNRISSEHPTHGTYGTTGDHPRPGNASNRSPSEHPASDAAGTAGGNEHSGGDPGGRFLSALGSGWPDRSTQLPGRFHPLARTLTGGAPVRLVTGAATRRALDVVGSAAATVGRTIYLAEAPGSGSRHREILAHELVHAARPSPVPRFFADPRPSAEERLAHDTGRRVAAGLPLVATPLGTSRSAAAHSRHPDPTTGPPPATTTLGTGAGTRLVRLRRHVGPALPGPSPRLAPTPAGTPRAAAPTLAGASRGAALALAGTSKGTAPALAGSRRGPGPAFAGVFRAAIFAGKPRGVPLALAGSAEGRAPTSAGAPRALAPTSAGVRRAAGRTFAGGPQGGVSAFVGTTLAPAPTFFTGGPYGVASAFGGTTLGSAPTLPGLYRAAAHALAGASQAAAPLFGGAVRSADAAVGGAPFAGRPATSSVLPTVGAGLRRAAVPLGAAPETSVRRLGARSAGAMAGGVAAPVVRRSLVEGPPAAGQTQATMTASATGVRRPAAPDLGASISRHAGVLRRETSVFRGFRDADHAGGAVYTPPTRTTPPTSTRTPTPTPTQTPGGQRRTMGTAGLPVGGLSNVVGPPPTTSDGATARRQTVHREQARRPGGDPTAGALTTAGGGGGGPSQASPQTAGGGTPPPTTGPTGGSGGGNNSGGPAAETADNPTPAASAFDDIDRLVELLEERLLAELERRGARFRGGPF